MKITLRRLFAALIITALAAGPGFCQLSIPKSWYNSTDSTLAVGRNVASQSMIKSYISTYGFSVLPEAADTTMWPVFSGANTGAANPKTHAGWTFNASTGMLTGTGFTGPVTGTASGNPSTASLAALSTGLLKSTTGTGALSIGALWTDYAGASFAYAALADQTYIGFTIAGVAGEILAVGDIVYLKAADSRWWKARGNAAATMSVQPAMAVSAAAAGAAVTLLKTGFVRDDTFPAVAVGAPCYISDATAGAIIATVPSDVGDLVQVVGFGTEVANILLWDPDPTIVTVGTALPTFPTGTIVGTSDTQTLTNKRVTERVVPASTTATPTPNADITDIYYLTLADDAVFGAPTGTPLEGDRLLIKIRSAAEQTLDFNAIYRFGDVPKPTVTVAGKVMVMNFVYDGTDGTWDLWGKVGNYAIP